MLSNTQRISYGEEGILSPVPVLDSEEVHGFRNAFESLETRLGGRCPYLGWSHLFFDWSYRLVTHPLILEAVADLLGDEILVHGSLVLCKYPHDAAFVAWHQDGIYSQWHGSPSTTVWIALTEADAENGCLRVIPGSHRHGVRPHLPAGPGGNLLRNGEEIAGGVDESTARDVRLRAGEMALLQNYTIHGSEPNRCDRKRIGFIARYATPDLTTARDPVILARGSRVPTHLPLLAEAPGRDEAAAFNAWLAYKRHRDSMVTSTLPGAPAAERL